MAEEKAYAKADYDRVGYKQKDVVSALIKSMRLGGLEDAYYWIQVMQAAGESYYYMAITLIIFAYEDCYEDEVIMISDACWRSMMAQKQKGVQGDGANTVIWWVNRLCRARKFWECEEGRYREKMWYKVTDEIEADGCKRALPSYALDSHSYSGWKIKREGGEFDERFSGHREGRANMCAMYERDGKLDPDAEPAIKQKTISNWQPEITILDAKSGVYLVESQNEAGLKYKVNVVSGDCDCPHRQQRGAHCKHLVKAEALHEKLEKERQERGQKKGNEELPF